MRLEQFDYALKKGFHFLGSTQDEIGSWTDFDLEVGRSTTWVTAYVVSALHRDPDVKEIVRLASEWLLKKFRPGWGYNETVPTDCDSTAWGILALTTAGVKLPASSFELLSQFRSSDGLYQTFSDRELDDHWGDTHLDVTVIALRALLATESSEIDAVFQTGERVIEIGEKDEWRAYWWKDQMYAVAHALETLSEFARWMELHRSIISRGEHLKRNLVARINDLKAVWCATLHTDDLAIDPFATALRLKAAVFGGSDGDTISYIANSLLKLQQLDGRWTGGKKLRVTDRSLVRPWEHQNAGPLFADTASIFTTATVLDALQSQVKTARAL